MRSSFMGWILSTAALVFTAVCPASATIHDITIGNNFFSPLGTIIQAGDTVRWTWVGGILHTTTSDPSSPKQWNSPTSSTAGFKFLLQFTAADGPGPFPYHCAIHPTTMKDTIFVNCCSGHVGDANGMGGDTPTIGDVSVMIDAKFITGTCTGLIPCLAEADVNQSGGLNPTCNDITIGDISYLIDYLFITGPSLGLPTCL